MIKRMMMWALMLTPFSSMAQQPLAPLKYEPLPLGAIQPQGWLLDQLHIMKTGATGTLDEYYWKVKNDNGWLGGKGDGWEETPYWLDGAVPLAYLLNDAGLKKKVQAYIDWSLVHQRPSGFFGPLTKNERAGKKTEDDCANGEDWWPRMVMLKVLQQYYTATNDKRVLPFMTKYFRYQLNSLKTCPIGKWTDWATARGGDNLHSIYWLYRQTGDAFLLELGDLVYQQTTPWTRYFGERNWVMEAAAQQNGQAWMDRHGVNVAMGIKLPAIYHQAKGGHVYLDSLRTGFKDIMTLHGLPHGMFSSDEDLHGNDPQQGIELCATVETMYSLEEILSITGEQSWADAIERMTFNALPGQITDDFISRQYFQVANQVQVTRGVFQFSLPFNREMNNVFGPYAGYTCCTANMHQGWTKFTANLWYATPDKGLAALLYSPSKVTAKVGNNAVPVTVTEQTDYPFGDRISLTVNTKQSVTFPLSLRVPAWCKQAAVLVNGQAYGKATGGNMVRIERTWKNNDKVELQLPMEVTTSNWAKNSRTVERGPLVYALKIEEEWRKDSIKEEGVYYQVLPKSDWNYGLPREVIKDPAKFLEVKTRAMPSRFVWNATSSPVEIVTKGKKIPEWKIVDGVARQPVTTREDVYQGKVDPTEHRITLIPYGCSKLRIVAFPVVP
ncbi:glycoside hydrolase family 127 protein [Chitinophaga horti]|uniref:Glycoside hydrolase family 127 protein n=1 Tax=Chitinophaga horti TaxID=2920382 RepID=A0ABY6J393_9BACT|nr:glycoside hydrolase family 127 protein [Chitinophaga horti]UYQ94048.1 glycoside hydrolase family 127 protein [Chitinophaga horti]